jgi:hypothetical protein
VNKLAFLEKGGFLLDTRKGRAKLKQYLDKTDEFIRQLYAAMHVTDGMLARGEEFRVLRWADIVSV